MVAGEMGSGSVGRGLKGNELLPFMAQFIRGRWFALFASFLTMAGAGATYLFGTYSKQIKATLGYDQTTLNLLGFFKDLGGNVGVLSGLVDEVTPTWFVLLLGAALNFGGYFMIWLAVTGKIDKPKVWQMCIYICVGSNSQNFANTGALVTSVKNFPASRGAMLGLLKGFAGLSGAIMTQLYLAIYGNDSKSLILLIAWLPSAISVIFLYTIRTIRPVKHPNELRVLYNFLYSSILLAVFLMALTLAEKFVIFSKAEYAGATSVVCFFLFVPLFISIREEMLVWNIKKQPINPPSEVKVEQPKPEAVESKQEADDISIREEMLVWNIKKQPINPPSEVKVEQPKPEAVESKQEADEAAERAEEPDANSQKSCLLTIFDRPERGEDYTILQAFTSIDMWTLFLATLCGLGSSLTAVNNLGQIGESLGYPNKTVTSFVSLVSIWNYFGRVFSGFVSETLLAKYKIPRPLMMTAVLVLACIGYLLVAFPAPGSLYVASIIIGFSFGAQLPLLLAIISELFGMKHYSTLFNCGQLASPLGSYIFDVKITGYLYDREALKDLAAKGLTRSSVKELTCIGSHCYRLPFIVLAIVTFFGAMTSLILVARTRKFYQSDIYKKFRENADNL